MELTYTLSQIQDAARSLWNSAINDRVVAFHGEMGSGKTTLIHALCDVLGVKDSIGSPTFSIINEYIYYADGSARKIYHIDLYRLRDAPEAIQAGVEDCLYSDHTCFIEWPEKILSLLPGGTLHVYIELVDDTTRKLRIGDN